MPFQAKELILNGSVYAQLTRLEDYRGHETGNHVIRISVNRNLKSGKIDNLALGLEDAVTLLMRLSEALNAAVRQGCIVTQRGVQALDGVVTNG